MELQINGTNARFYETMPYLTRVFIQNSMERHSHLIKLGGDPVTKTIEDHIRGLITEHHYKNALNRITVGDSQLAAYPGWLARYYEQVSGEDVAHLKVYLKKYAFDNDRYQLVSSHNIIELHSNDRTE